MMLVSYLIATWNRKDALKRHLDLLIDQTWPEWFEVIVCDDGSNDGTHEFLAGLKNTPKYTFQWFDTGNTDKACVAQSRNNGIRAAKGDVIIMADDDCLPHRQMIESYVKNFKPDEVQVGYKSSHEVYLSMILPVPIEEGQMTVWWDDWRAGKFGHFQTNSCCMSPQAARTPAKDGSLGFDERFFGYGHEDTEFGRRVHAAGFRLVFNPDAVSWHMNPGATPQQDHAWKEAEKAKSSELMHRILAEPLEYPDNRITGWMSKEDLSWLYEMAQAMSSIVEVGSWQGRSTHALLSGCKGMVYAVDTWDVETMKPYGDARAAREAFFANTKEFTNLTVMEMASVKAAEAFKDKSVDMVFIDGDHSYEAVLADIKAWTSKTRKLICGHDFSSGWPGVDRAVTEIFGGGHGLVDSIWFKEL